VIVISSDIATASVGSQILVAILVGLLIAFAVQFLLTNLGLVLGISALKFRTQNSSKPDVESSQAQKPEAIRLGISKISFLAGLGILLTLNLVLFIACFLAVRFSTASDPISGATLGIVIWSTYFLILLWVSYSTVGSFMSWVFGSLTTKLRQLIAAISSSIPGTKGNVSEFLSEETVAKLIQQEINTALDKFDLQQHFKDYLETIPATQLDLTAINQGFADLLAKLDLKSYARTDLLQKIDRQTFITLINERTNLLTSEAEQVVKQLESVWQKAVVSSEKRDLNGRLLQWLQSVNPEELQFEQLSERLKQLVDKETENTSEDLSVSSPQTNQVSADLAVSRQSTWDWKAIKKALLKKVELSDVELEDIWDTLQSVYHQISSDEEIPQLSFNTIKNDVEDYLSHVPTWYLNCERGWQEFKEVIYDSQADSLQVRSQLEQLQPQDFIELLQQRDDLDLEKINQITEHLERIRQEVLSSLEEAELQQEAQKLGDRLLKQAETWQVEIASATQKLQYKLESYLRYTNPEHLTSEKIDSKLEQLQQEALTNLPESMQSHLFTIDRSALVKVLEKRTGLNDEQVKAIATQIATKWQKSHDYATQESSRIATQSAELVENLVDYLYQALEQNFKLSDLEGDLPQLLNLGKQKTTTAINQQLAQLNWDEIETKLKAVKNYSEIEIKQASKQLRKTLRKLIKSPRRWSTRTVKKVNNIVEELENFLSYSDKTELSLEKLERNLNSILKPLKSHTTEHLERPTKLTPEVINKSLASRQDLNLVEVKQISDRLIAITNKLSEEIQTTQKQTNQLFQQLLNEIGDYLNSLNLFHLSYDQIKNSLADFDFQSLTPAWQQIVAEIPLEQLSDRLGKLSYEALVTKTQAKELFSESFLPQIQGVQDYISQQIDIIKQTAYEQTLQQVEATRKAIAIATYWIFAIAFSSVVTSAIAGFLATFYL
jgi:hypothetical protein